MAGGTSPDDGTDGDPKGGPDGGSRADAAWDDALARLEDVLLAAPYDRALPGLSELLRRAEVPLSYVQQDDRALKLLHDALLARPLSSRQQITEYRGQVELMTLEVEVLTARLQDPDSDPATVASAQARLVQIGRELDRLRGLL